MDTRPTRSGGSWFVQRARSVACAARGVFTLVRTEPNSQIHLVCTVITVAVGFWLHLSGQEWCCIVVAIALIWIAEGLNSALEALADHVAPEQHPLVGRAKDVAAGAVMVASVAAIIIGLLVLGPKLLEKLN